MNFDVILRKQADNGFLARPVFWPEAEAHGRTETEALDEVRTMIGRLLGEARLVRVEVDVPPTRPENLGDRE